MTDTMKQHITALTFSHSDAQPIAAAPVITTAERARFRQVADLASHRNAHSKEGDEVMKAVEERGRILSIFSDERGMTAMQISKGTGYSYTSIRKWLGELS